MALAWHYGTETNHLNATLKAFGLAKGSLNSLSNNEVLDQPKLKELAENKLDVTTNLKFVLCMVEDIVGKG